MEKFEILFSRKIEEVLGVKDPAHDLAHVKRVVLTAKKLAKIEGALLEVIIPAAWLHDLVNLPKDHPERTRASAMAAQEAILFLESIDYPKEFFPAIYHAIHAHSFSSGVVPESIEAKIVQDADRLDALGAIGLARLFSISTQLNRPFYNTDDPFAKNRKWDDSHFAIDHIFIKLQKITHQMNTVSAHSEAQKRFQFIEDYLTQLKLEV